MPLVYYKIGLVTPAARRGVRRLAHATLLRRPWRIAGVSEECLEEAQKVFGVPRAKLVLLPNGRSAQVFHPRRMSSPWGLPVLTFVGHLIPSKRPELFIEVCRRLRERGLAFEARIVGDGPSRRLCEALAARAGVSLLGRRDDVPELLRETDVFVFPSIPEGEGMPGVLIEAALSGVATVTTDVPGARAVVRGGETGYVVGVDAAGDLLEAVARLLGDAELRAGMGARARAHAASELTLERSAGRWEALLGQVLAQKEPSSPVTA